MSTALGIEVTKVTLIETAKAYACKATVTLGIRKKVKLHVTFSVEIAPTR